MHAFSIYIFFLSICTSIGIYIWLIYIYVSLYVFFFFFFFTNIEMKCSFFYDTYSLTHTHLFICLSLSLFVSIMHFDRYICVCIFIFIHVSYHSFSSFSQAIRTVHLQTPPCKYTFVQVLIITLPFIRPAPLPVLGWWEPLITNKKEEKGLLHTKMMLFPHSYRCLDDMMHLAYSLEVCVLLWKNKKK